MLKVYQNLSPRFGRGIQRVAKAIQEHAPREVAFVDSIGPADLIVHHVIGVQNFHETATIDQLIAMYNTKRHACLQYCLRTTENPDLIWWDDHVWAHCEIVWSYYDLAELLAHPDGPDRIAARLDKRFYYAPLGVDPIFHGSIADRPKHPIYLICTSGYIPETEGVLECVEAAARAGGRVLHLGPKSLDLGSHVTYAEGISDAQLAALYKSCRYVAGLRRVEGFELPAAEGLCSGAMPICFDQPHYRRWFENDAEYVTESSVDEVTYQIERIFSNKTRRLDQVDIALAQRKFSWPRVVKGFWDRILAPVQTLSPIDELPHTPTAEELADLGRPIVDDEYIF